MLIELKMKNIIYLQYDMVFCVKVLVPVSRSIHGDGLMVVPSCWAAQLIRLYWNNFEPAQKYELNPILLIWL